MKLSIVIPALNEEKTIGICIEKALRSIKKLNIKGEVVIADNGSRDQTVRIAESLGARVVLASRKGYGSALMAGIKAAEGQYLIMGDADDTYSFEEIAPFYRKLEESSDFVMGNRFKGKIEKGAMPFLHRYLGTPVLTFLMNLFFKTGIGDNNCGMRGLTKKAFYKMRLKNCGMEFATEMIVKASLLKCKISEVPCNLYRDKRDRRPHLRTWTDGWRHLRFMLLFTPTWTYLVPAGFLLFLGFIGMSFLFLRDVFSPASFGILNSKHIISFLLVFLTGSHIFQLGVIAKTFSFSEYFDFADRITIIFLRHFKLEKGIGFGLLLLLFGAMIFSYLGLSYHFNIFYRGTDLIRFDGAIFGALCLLLGFQTVSASFVISLFYLKVK